MTVWQLQRSMPASELAEWIAYYQIEHEKREERDREQHLARLAMAGLEKRKAM